MRKFYLVLALTTTMAFILMINVIVFASGTDDKIESTAKKSYVFKTFLKDDDIAIQSKDGAVTMTGTVSEESHSALAKETVASLPGVKSVDNQLAIKGEAPAQYSDMWLVTKVKTSLLFHRNVSGFKTEVSADKGIITLRGEADSPAQRDLTAEYASDIDGVESVVNEMIVVDDATKKAEKTIGERIDDAGEMIDDVSITAMVKIALLYHRSTSSLSVTVETTDGVVTLGGTASNAAQKDLTTKLVNDVHGVEKVINNIVVEEAKPKNS